MPGEITQKCLMPDVPRPIVSIGAGGIVKNAHYPAYKLAGFEVVGLYDPNQTAADALSVEFSVPVVTDSVHELTERFGTRAIYDLATPAAALPEILSQLPQGSTVLMQKPMGETLDQAKEVVKICTSRNLNASVNFQLRYAPYVRGLKNLIAQGVLGDLIDLEFNVNVYTPWALWAFLEKAPRMEMVYHSIHYLDLVRDLFGEPEGLYAKSIKHPQSPNLESSRSTVILDFGPMKRAIINTYHGHDYGPRHQHSYIKLEGTKGAAKIQMGLNMNYPKGAGDYLEYCQAGSTDWVNVPLIGSWFPQAFIGPMAAAMRSAEGKGSPETHIQDALKTMELVEACTISSDKLGWAKAT